MLNILISLLTFVLILISLFMVLVILMQRANTNSGMGSAFGGGVAESAFGTETTNILVKATKWSAVGFFVIALVLYLLFMSRDRGGTQPSSNELPDIPVMEQTATEAPVEMDQAVDEATADDAATTEAGAAAEGVDASADPLEDVLNAIDEDAAADDQGDGEPNPGP